MSNKEIGIITFSGANNFGAMLQCYALSKVIKDLGYTPFIIDSKYEKKPQNLKSKFRNFLISIPFNKFRKNHLPVIKRVNELKNIVVGSDQVWNMEIIGENWKHFFGDFPKHNVISYAASFGVETLDSSYDKTAIKNILRNYQAISVRENEGCYILNNDLGISAVQVLDPTLLVDDYTDLLNHTDIKHNSENYVAVFLFNKNKNRLNSIAKFCSNEGLKFDMLNEFKNDFGARNSSLLTVPNWLKKIKEASFVITDSYHCMIFSIIFNKKFLVLTANPKRTSRIKTLLTALGLSNFYLEEIESIADIQSAYDVDVNYSVVKMKIDELKSVSLDFLSSALRKCD